MVPPPAGFGWREEGEDDIVASTTYARLMRRSGRGRVVRSGPSTGASRPPQIRRGQVAKPVELRHSPATVTAPLGRKSGRRPAVAARTFERKVRRSRAIHRLTPASTPEAGVIAVSPLRLEHFVDARPIRAGRRRPARTISPILAALLAVLLAACSGAGATPAPTDAAPRTAAATPTATVAPTDAPSATAVAEFPVTITDDEGTSLTIATEPQRIVTLTPAATETLFALGLGDRVVGRAADVTLLPARGRAHPRGRRLRRRRRREGRGPRARPRDRRAATTSTSPRRSPSCATSACPSPSCTRRTSRRS